MNILRALAVFLFLGSPVLAFAQTDPNVVPVDSALLNPDKKNNPEAKTIRPDSIVNIKSVKTIDQKDNPPVVKDSARLALERMPGRAVRHSAIVPGWGQINNDRWWKVPIIYAGFIGLGYSIQWNNKYYQKMLSEIKYYRNNGGVFKNPLYNQPGITDQSLIPHKDYYRRNRDLCILSCAALYAVNLIDAYVDAKFFRYDVSDELTLRVYPTAQPSTTFASAALLPGFTIKLAL